MVGRFIHMAHQARDGGFPVSASHRNNGNAGRGVLRIQHLDNRTADIAPLPVRGMQVHT